MNKPVQIFKSDVGNFLTNHEHPKEGYNLIFLDPPFNLSKNYGKGIDDNIPNYEEWYQGIVSKIIPFLAKGGSLLIYNTPANNLMITEILRKKLTFKHWITVEMKNSLPIRGRLYPSHYSLLYFTNGPCPTFDPPRLPVKKCRHCDGELADYGGHRNKLNPNGLNLSDVWTDLSPVRHSKNKNRGANELPVRLIYRILRMTTKEGDRVLDLFSGSGVLSSIGSILNRDCTAVDLNVDAVILRLDDQSRDIELLSKEVVFHDKLE